MEPIYAILIIVGMFLGIAFLTHWVVLLMDLDGKRLESKAEFWLKLIPPVWWIYWLIDSYRNI